MDCFEILSDILHNSQSSTSHIILSSSTQRTGTQLVSRTMHLPEQQWSQCGVWERSREPERWARLASPWTRPCPAHSQQPGTPAIREALQPNTHSRSVYKNISLKLCDQLLRSTGYMRIWGASNCLNLPQWDPGKFLPVQATRLWPILIGAENLILS